MAAPGPKTGTCSSDVRCRSRLTPHAHAREATSCTQGEHRNPEVDGYPPYPVNVGGSAAAVESVPILLRRILEGAVAPRYCRAMRTSPTLRNQRALAVLVAGAYLSLSSPAVAAPGELDPTFSEDGILTTNFTRESDYASAVVVQADGKIVAAGRAGGVRGSSGGRFALARYGIDGTLDVSFSADGLVTTNLLPRRNDEVADLAIQTDGKIVAAGFVGSCCAGPYQNGRFGLVRYNADGVLDATFSGDGIVILNWTDGNDFAAALAIQADGKIVVGGRESRRGGRFALARYNSDGTRDRTFSRDGKVTVNFTVGNDFVTALRVQANGKIVAGGGAAGTGTGRFALARFNEDGTLDRSFGLSGKVTTAFPRGTAWAWALAIQQTGKILVGGSSRGNGRIALARYDRRGRLDRSFAGDGKLETNLACFLCYEYATDVMVGADGKILVVADANARFALVRYTADGALDPSFGNGGKVATDFNSPEGVYPGGGAIQADGRIVVSGSADSSFALARYLGG